MSYTLELVKPLFLGKKRIVRGNKCYILLFDEIFSNKSRE